METTSVWSTLGEVTEVKYLGLVLSKDCKWNLHWKYVRGRANRAAFAIMKLAGYLKLRVSGVIEMVRAVILAILFYGVPAWAPPEGGFEEMDRLAMLPVRTALGVPRTAGHRAVLVEAGVVPAVLSWDYLCLATARRVIKRSSSIENPAAAILKCGRVRRNESLVGIIRW